MEHEKLTSLNQGPPEGTLPDFAASDPAFPYLLASALLDGELRGEAFARACIALESDAQARQRWHDYHLVGEALRHGAEGLGVAVASACTHDELFLSRLQARLAQEAVAAGSSDGRIEHLPGKHTPDRRTLRQGANDPYGAWRFTAGLCALVVVGLLGWQGVTGLQSASQVRQLAQSRPDARSDIRADAGRRAMPQRVSEPVNTSSMFASSTRMAQPFLSTQPPDPDGRMVMLRDPRLDHLMARQGGAGARMAADGRFPRPRLGRPGVAAQGVLVNLDKNPAQPR
jgi:sigma-E factor negative regulatory protein RseA